ncbi:sensor histidine kinase [Paraflavitalea speifideaquila]|uniref:sensor histidine kinase n=1 Tax=Paraflavitalea speifideaquila TaxID=3076558 RepID=UPI0028E3771C|nr:ATP-binding protein [Paraflavitalea speifideiaquila]
MLLTVTTGGLIWLFIRQYVKGKLRKQQQIIESNLVIEKERMRIAAELHDDLGGELSSIRLVTEMMHRQGGESSVQLGKISESSRGLVQRMNEIVWALNVNNDKLSNLIAYLRQYAVQFLDELGIDCRVVLPEAIPDIAVKGNIRRHVFLLVKEALNNIVKHAGAQQVTITITIEDELMISIQDDGKGLPTSFTSGQGNGLFNMGKRMEEIGGRFDLKSSAGTTCCFMIPITLLSHKSVS